MYSYRRISAPVTLDEAREHAAELGRKFVFSRYLVAEVAWPSRTEVDVVEVSEPDEGGEYPTVNAVMVGYIEWHEHAGAEVRSIAAVPRAA